MNIEDLSRLEIKINNLVGNIKDLREENSRLKTRLDDANKETTELDRERSEIKNKVTSLIELIESVETPVNNSNI